MASVSNIQGDQFETTIGTLQPFTAQFRRNIIQDIHMVTSGNKGTTPLLPIVQGQQVELTITSQEVDLATIKAALNISTGDVLPAVGTKLAGVPVKFHPLGVSGDSEDIRFPTVVFTRVEEDSDGQGERTITITGMAFAAPDNNILEFGAPAE